MVATETSSGDRIYALVYFRAILEEGVAVAEYQLMLHRFFESLVIVRGGISWIAIFANELFNLSTLVSMKSPSTIKPDELWLSLVAWKQNRTPMVFSQS